MVARWPELEATQVDPELETRFERLQEVIVAVRNVRAFYKISPKQPLKLFMRCAPEVAEQMQAVADQFDNLSRTMLEAAGVDINRPGASGTFSLNDAEGYIPLEGLIDTEAERARQAEKREEVLKHISGADAKLSNENFVNRAPEQVVNDVRETRAKLQTQLESIDRMLEELSAS